MVLFFKYVRQESHRKASFGLQSNAGSQGVLGALIIFIIISVNQPLVIPFQFPTCYLSPCIPLFYCNHCFPSLSLPFRIVIIIPLVKNVFVIFFHQIVHPTTRQLMAFQVDLTSVKNEAGRNIWRKSPRLLGTTILVREKKLTKQTWSIQSNYHVIKV